MADYSGADLISTLPGDILANIVSRLDTKEAIRTSVLARGWRHIWTTIPPPSHVDKEKSLPLFFNLKDFAIFNQRATIIKDSQEQEKTLIVSCFYSDDANEIPKWIFYSIPYQAENLNVKKARITTKVPLHFFKKIEISDSDVPNVIHMGSLERLVLNNCSFENSSSSNFPVVIHTPKLKYFSLDNKDFVATSCIYEGIVLIASNLQDLHFSGYPFLQCDFTGIDLLGEVHLAVTCGEANDISSEVTTEKAPRVIKLLEGVTKAKSLNLNAPAFQEFPQLLELSDKEYAFSHLKILTVCILEGCENEVKFVKCMVKSSLNLETVIIKMSGLSDDEFEDLKAFGRKIFSVANEGVKVIVKSTEMEEEVKPLP